MTRNRVISAGFVAGLLLLAASGATVRGQAAAPAPYLDPDLDFEARARDLVSRMSVEEKVSQLTNQAAAIPRLGVPAYEWWNECLHGVARAGVATVFPQAIGLAATFDEPLMHEMAGVIADEARAKHHQFVRQGKRGRYQGLTFWSPNINIFRDPRWGRGQETYGEDPYLAGRLGVAFVKGLQGDDPRYYKVIATAKHFAVHSGPEPDRHHFDARPSERDLHETYLPAFRALVQEGKVASVMSAYNRVNGESASASQRLLLDVLRKEWGFDGYVVSDCGAIDDIYMRHKLVATAEEASALGVTKGCDLECGSAYRTLGKAVERGLLREADLDVAVRRLMLARMKLGMFDPPERVAYARIPYSVNDAPEHDRLARRVARESIVLLKNDGVLPLRKDLGTVAVVGPNADDLVTLLGNYNGTPSRPVTVLAGIRAAVSPATRVLYARGVDLVEGRQDPRATEAIGAAFLRPAPGSSEHGLTGAYFRGQDLQGEPVLTRVDPSVAFRWDRGAPTDELVARGELSAERALESDSFSVRWTGVLVPPASGEYELTVTGNDGVRLFVDGRKVLEEWSEASVSRAVSARVSLEAGREHALKARVLRGRAGRRGPAGLAPAGGRHAVRRGPGRGAGVGRRRLRRRPHRRGRRRGDEGRLPGLRRRRPDGHRAARRPEEDAGGAPRHRQAGGARAHHGLRAGRELGEGEPARHPPRLVPGPAGRERRRRRALRRHEPRRPPARHLLRVRLRSCRPFADYAMEGRTYKYFRGEPLYPFGHGLSYTRFEYSGLRLSRTRLGALDRLEVSLDVKNAGARDGEEVVQLYARDVEARKGAPIRQLRGFERVRLAAGEQRRVAFALVPERDLARYDEARKAFTVEPGEFEIEVGASSRDLRLRTRVSVE